MIESKQKIAKIINNIYPLSNQSIELILEIIELKTINKMEDFIHHNSKNISEYLVVEGICRSYISDFNGNEATLSFFLEGSALPPNQTRTVNDISLLNFQALSNSVLAFFSRDRFAKLMLNNREIEKWGLSVSSNELKLKVEKELDLITLPAKDRLVKFRDKFPLLENRIPHPYIASYLGISPVSLSRLRSQKL